MNDIREALKDDPFVNSLKRPIQNEENVVDFEFKHDLLYYSGLLYVPLGPNQLKVLQMGHDLLAVGHFGFNITMELISRDYWCLQMWKFVKKFIGSCYVCARAKISCHQ